MICDIFDPEQCLGCSNRGEPGWYIYDGLCPYCLTEFSYERACIRNELAYYPPPEITYGEWGGSDACGGVAFGGPNLCGKRHCAIVEYEYPDACEKHIYNERPENCYLKAWENLNSSEN